MRRSTGRIHISDFRQHALSCEEQPVHTFGTIPAHSRVAGVASGQRAEAADAQLNDRDQMAARSWIVRKASPEQTEEIPRGTFQAAERGRHYLGFRGDLP